ncbi:hypothetical protein DFH27DRAFT_511844 [Peziza echinospora]|nr:hypothetical protein DFH27DRAFT_511844 [Peziza echinospora]
MTARLLPLPRALRSPAHRRRLLHTSHAPQAAAATADPAPHTHAPLPPPQPTIFSGIQPTGIPHLGNYLGALRQWATIQNTAPPTTKLVYCVVDLHAITKPQRPEELRRWKREALATLLAIGLDPKRSILFEQSRVPAHSELMWILSTISSMGGLNRMTQWKSKSSLAVQNSTESAQNQKSLQLGLFSYPVLQAADILIHGATQVPVGEDQAQHLELTRNIAASFNHLYGPTFYLPETVLPPAKRVMSLRDPTSKMSKSDKDPRSRILLTDPPTTILSKISAAVTDSIAGVSYDPTNRPGVSNLVELFSHMQGRTDFEVVAREFEGRSIKEFKGALGECLVEELRGVRAEYERIMEDGGEAYLEEVAREGAVRASESAEGVLGRVKRAMGLL